MLGLLNQMNLTSENEEKKDTPNSPTKVKEEELILKIKLKNEQMEVKSEISPPTKLNEEEFKLKNETIQVKSEISKTETILLNDHVRKYPSTNGENVTMSINFTETDDLFDSQDDDRANFQQHIEATPLKQMEQADKFGISKKQSFESLMAKIDIALNESDRLVNPEKYNEDKESENKEKSKNENLKLENEEEKKIKVEETAKLKKNIKTKILKSEEKVKENFVNDGENNRNIIKPLIEKDMSETNIKKEAIAQLKLMKKIIFIPEVKLVEDFESEILETFDTNVFQPMTFHHKNKNKKMNKNIETTIKFENQNKKIENLNIKIENNLKNKIFKKTLIFKNTNDQFDSQKTTVHDNFEIKELTNKFKENQILKLENKNDLIFKEKTKKTETITLIENQDILNDANAKLLNKNKSKTFEYVQNCTTADESLNKEFKNKEQTNIRNSFRHVFTTLDKLKNMTTRIKENRQKYSNSNDTEIFLSSPLRLGSMSPRSPNFHGGHYQFSSPTSSPDEQRNREINTRFLQTIKSLNERREERLENLQFFTPKSSCTSRKIKKLPSTITEFTKTNKINIDEKLKSSEFKSENKQIELPKKNVNKVELPNKNKEELKTPQIQSEDTKEKLEKEKENLNLKNKKDKKETKKCNINKENVPTEIFKTKEKVKANLVKDENLTKKLIEKNVNEESIKEKVEQSKLMKKIISTPEIKLIKEEEEIWDTPLSEAKEKQISPVPMNTKEEETSPVNNNESSFPSMDSDDEDLETLISSFAINTNQKKKQRVNKVTLEMKNTKNSNQKHLEKEIQKKNLSLKKDYADQENLQKNQGCLSSLFCF